MLWPPVSGDNGFFDLGLAFEVHWYQQDLFVSHELQSMDAVENLARCD